MRTIDGDMLIKELEKDRGQCVNALNRSGLPQRRKELLEFENDIYMVILKRLRDGDFDVKGD